MAASAAAERAAGIGGNLNLVRFDTATPGDARLRLITGLQTTGEKAIGLDTRPATGELFLVTTPAGVVSGSTVVTRVYRLDPRRRARHPSGEAVSLEVALLGRARAVRIARVGDVVLAQRSLPLSAATRRVRLKPRRRLVGPTKRFTVRLRVAATDVAGKRRTVVKRIRVRPAARR